MDLLSGYQSENDEAVDESVSYQPKQSAPQLVVYKPTSSSNSVQKYVNLNSTLNTTVENMFESELGPINPFVGSLSNKATGNKLKVQEVFVEDHFFNESYQSFLHEGIQKPDRIKSSTNKGNKTIHT